MEIKCYDNQDSMNIISQEIICVMYSYRFLYREWKIIMYS